MTGCFETILAGTYFGFVGSGGIGEQIIMVGG